MVFQDPHSAINPVHRIDDFLTETFRRGTREERRDAERRAVSLLEEVRIKNPARVMRARCLAAHPARLRDRCRLIPRVALCTGHGLAATDAGRLAGIPGCPRERACAVIRGAATRGHSLVPSLGDAQRPRAG